MDGVSVLWDEETGTLWHHMTGEALARTAEWDGQRLVLDDGTVFESGVLHDAAGQRVPVERPLQLSTRWYGWALMYPDAEIGTPET